jgi:hypothetical protein
MLTFTIWAKVLTLFFYKKEDTFVERLVCGMVGSIFKVGLSEWFSIL